MPTTQARQRYQNVSSNLPSDLWGKCVQYRGGGSAHLRKIIVAYKGDDAIKALIEAQPPPEPADAAHTLASLTPNQWNACKAHPGRSGAMHLRILANAYEQSAEVRAAVDEYARVHLL